MNVDTDGHMDRLTNSLRKGGMMGWKWSLTLVTCVMIVILMEKLEKPL
jgi:hypothetical protein